MEVHNVNVIGLGKLGRPLAAVLAAAGHRVFVDDVSGDAIVATVDNRDTDEPQVNELQASAPEQIRIGLHEDAYLTFVIVPTPSKPGGSFDASHVRSALAPDQVRRGHVVLVSTVSPGTCDALDHPNLVYAPTFVALGQVVRDLQHPRLSIVGAPDPRGEAALGRYLRVMRSVHFRAPYRLTYVEAELAKLAVNAYVTTKISYANMVDEICDAWGADGRRVLQAVGGDPRIGHEALRAGGPFGGPCFPRDNRALQEAAHRVRQMAPIPALVDGLNDHQVQRWLDAVQMITRMGGSVGILGVSYKPGTTWTEMSLGVRLGELLERDYAVLYHDPKVRTVNGQPVYGDLGEVLGDSDTVVVCTPHDEYIDIDHDRLIDPWRITQP